MPIGNITIENDWMLIIGIIINVAISIHIIKWVE